MVVSIPSCVLPPALPSAGASEIPSLCLVTLASRPPPHTLSGSRLRFPSWHTPPRSCTTPGRTWRHCRRPMYVSQPTGTQLFPHYAIIRPSENVTSLGFRAHVLSSWIDERSGRGNL